MAKSFCIFAARAIICLAVLLGFGHATAAERMLHIEGTFSLMQPSGKATHWTDFSISVSGSRYQTSNHYFNGECLMSGSNGSNSCFLNKMATVAQNRWELGEVTADRFPSKDASAGQLCWLAFASIDYFTNASATLPMEAFQQNAKYLQCHYVLSTNPPYLPLTIEWYGSNFWYLHMDDAADRIDLPYTNGFLAGEYLVTSTTNFEYLELPLSFEFSTFIPSFMGNVKQTVGKKDVTLTSVLRARVNTIRFADTMSDFRPPLGQRAQITDFRVPLLPDNSHLSVTRMNGNWPEPRDADFLRNLAIAGQTAKPSSPSTSFATRAVLFVMLISSAGFLLILMKQKRKERQ